MGTSVPKSAGRPTSIHFPKSTNRVCHASASVAPFRQASSTRARSETARGGGAAFRAPSSRSSGAVGAPSAAGHASKIVAAAAACARDAGPRCWTQTGASGISGRD